MQNEELIRNSVESEERKEFYTMIIASNESDSGICYTDIYLSEIELEKLRKLHKKYGTIYFCNHLEEEFSSGELEILLNGKNPKDIEGIFFEEPCYLILHSYDEIEPSEVGYLTFQEYYLSHNVIRLSKEDYIKLLVILVSGDLATKNFKFKDLEKINHEFFNTLKKQTTVLALPEDNPFEDPEFISWNQMKQRAIRLKEKYDKIESTGKRVVLFHQIKFRNPEKYYNFSHLILYFYFNYIQIIKALISNSIIYIP